MKKIDVEETILNILEQEGQEKGIQQIRDIINSISKGRRRKKIRVNSYDSIAVKVYILMNYNDYSRTRAIDKVAEECDISISTVNNHLIKFDKKAKEDDFMNFGYWTYDTYFRSNRENFYEEYEESDAIHYGKMYNLNENESRGYYLKYKLQLKKSNNFKPDKFSKYSIPF